jgi:hypothetical protein
MVPVEAPVPLNSRRKSNYRGGHLPRRKLPVAPFDDLSTLYFCVRSTTSSVRDNPGHFHLSEHVSGGSDWVLQLAIQEGGAMWRYALTACEATIGHSIPKLQNFKLAKGSERVWLMKPTSQVSIIPIRLKPINRWLEKYPRWLGDSQKLN